MRRRQQEIDLLDVIDEAEDIECTDFVGMETQAVIDGGVCNVDGEIQLVGSGVYDCADGTQLTYNDYGWGYIPGTFQAHERPDGQQVPPDGEFDACNPD